MAQVHEHAIFDGLRTWTLRVVSYAVLRRTGKIGIRMALGAQAGDVLRMMLRDSQGLVLLGVLLCSAGALATGRYLASRLYGLSTTDALTYGVVGGLLLVVAALAAFLPARRAAKVDPLVALRAE